MVKCATDAFGWNGEDIKKETDVHNGSTDGNGQFNWRMKFPLVIPCPFPRLKFSVFDFNVFSSDDSIGECTISFMKLFKKLKREGKYISGL